MTLFNPYKIVTALLISCLVSISLSTAIPWYKVTYNESLCSCTAGTGSSSSFNYTNYFNQGLNTTNVPTFNSINLLPDGQINSWTSDNMLHLIYYTYGLDFIYNNTYELFFGSDLNLGSRPYVYGFYTSNSYSNILEFDTTNDKVTLPLLSGSGSAFACLNKNGTLYRSGTACV